MNTPSRLRCLVLVALVAGIVIGATLMRPVLGSQDKGQPTTAGPRYSVVFTEGTNLCVTDNQTLWR
jgi:hypothetical protein